MGLCIDLYENDEFTIGPIWVRDAAGMAVLAPEIRIKRLRSNRNTHYRIMVDAPQEMEIHCFDKPIRNHVPRAIVDSLRRDMDNHK